jgi:leucyl aminopeptidase (aminopeptidase T)
MNNPVTATALSPQWAINIVHTCVAVQAGDKVLIMVDEPLNDVREALLYEALKAQPRELWSFTFPNSTRPFDAYPAHVLTLATQVDAVILLLASLDAEREIPAWVNARETIRNGRARFSAGAYINQSILDHELSADYEQIAAFTHALAARLHGSAQARITTPLGTDLRLSLVGREWKLDTGMLRGQGVYGNLPAGEIYIAPLEASAEGILVIDKSLPGLLLHEPVRLVFEAGRVTHIDGGPGAEYFHQAIAQHGDATRVIAELGIGTNPQARLQGNVITDEKVLGTIHVAIGRNDFIGGTTVVTTHIDGVVGQPTLEIDGKRLISQGEFLLFD